MDTTMPTHMLTDANGHAMTMGLTAEEARRIAQEQADAREETVTITPYRYDEDGERIDEQDAEWTVVPVSDDQIEALRAEAGEAGDDAQTALCDAALDGDRDARVSCGRAIRWARAQASGDGE